MLGHKVRLKKQRKVGLDWYEYVPLFWKSPCVQRPYWVVRKVLKNTYQLSRAVVAKVTLS